MNSESLSKLVPGGVVLVDTPSDTVAVCAGVDGIVRVWDNESQAGQRAHYLSPAADLSDAPDVADLPALREIVISRLAGSTRNERLAGHLTAGSHSVG